MQTRSKPTTKNDGIFFSLLFLTTFFFLFEISFFVLCNKTYLSDFDFVSSHLTIPLSILPGIFYFVLVQLGLHLSFCILIWWVVTALNDFFHVSATKQLSFGIGIWCLGVVTILAANQYYFPNTKMADLLSVLILNQHAAKIFFVLMWVPSFLLLGVATAWWLNMAMKKSPYYLFVFIVSLAATLFFLFKPESLHVKDAASAQKPNIIIVGIDSLRPDFLSYFGAENTSPFLDSFLNQATVFSEAVTPLARTFPSWTSILTGQYPRQVGVRFNLAGVQGVKLDETLPAILQQHGYRTIYATDEVRFSNVDKYFGFDRLITPPIGLNDFLVGTFNDFPLSNLFVNSRVGRWLFPYSYANRPVFFTYEPDSFLQLLQPTLRQARKQPLFLAVHFCLPHNPYMWADLPANEYTAQERYVQSVARVDQQVNDFFVLLKRYHLLEHAIVVLLSDHGEALELPGDRITEKDLFVGRGDVPKFYPSGLDHTAINLSAGHGTDVLGLPQYHTVLAFRLYGTEAVTHPSTVAGVVSLMDIKPTLLELLHLPSAPTSGESLVAFIKGQKTAVKQHEHIFLESDYTPDAIRTVYPETRQVVLEGIQLFQIDPHTTRLTVKDTMGEMIIHSKQYADIYGDWMLALYPQNLHTRMPILINLQTGQWTNDLQSKFAQQSPALDMLKTMQAFYGKELGSKS